MASTLTCGGLAGAMLLSACGPGILDGQSTGDGTGDPIDSTTTATTASSATGATTGALADSTGSNGSTTDADSTGPVVGTEDDPGTPCGGDQPGLTFLWCGEGIVGTPIEVDSTWVYFVRDEVDLWRVPLAGGDAELLLQEAGDIHWIEVLGEDLYWATFFGGEVGHLVLPEGPAEILAAGLFKPNRPAIAGDHVFVPQYGEGLALVRIALTGGDAFPLYSGLDYAGHAFVDGPALYFVTGTNSSNDSTLVHRGTLDGGPDEVVFDARGLQGLLLEGQSLWWADYGVDQSSIRRTPLFDPGAEQIVSEREDHPLTLALTEPRVYWNEFGEGIGRLVSVPREGGPQQVHLAFDSNPRMIKGSAAGVVVATASAIVLVASE